MLLKVGDYFALAIVILTLKCIITCVALVTRFLLQRQMLATDLQILLLSVILLFMDLNLSAYFATFAVLANLF